MHLNFFFLKNAAGGTVRINSEICNRIVLSICYKGWKKKFDEIAISFSFTKRSCAFFQQSYFFAVLNLLLFCCDVGILDLAVRLSLKE